MDGKAQHFSKVAIPLVKLSIMEKTRIVMIHHLITNIEITLLLLEVSGKFAHNETSTLHSTNTFIFFCFTIYW